MSYMLPHLDSGWAVDQAVLSEEDRVVIIRFGHDDDETWYATSFIFATLIYWHRTLSTTMFIRLRDIIVLFFFRFSMLMDEVLFSIADDVKNFGVIYLVDITEVPDFSSMCV